MISASNLVSLRAVLMSLLALVLFAAACSESASVASSERGIAAEAEPSGTMEGSLLQPVGTPYRQLNLDSPEDTALLFIDAWSRRDFHLVQQLLAVPAQREAFAAANNKDYSAWVLRPAAGSPLGEEHILPTSLFSQSLWIAANADLLRVDVTDARVLSVVAEAEEGGRPSAIVALELPDGAAGELAMVASVSGRWRVSLIGLPSVVGAKAREVIVTDACTQDRRIELLPDVPCSALDELGDDGRVTSRTICLIMQGHQVKITSSDLQLVTVDRARELVGDICPGDPELVTSYFGKYLEEDRFLVDPDETYGALDLSSPEGAVGAFLERFEGRDFFTMLLAVDIATQRYEALKIARAELDSLSRASWQQVTIDIEGDVNEHFPSVAGHFDNLMQAAWEADDYIIDPRGAVISSVEAGGAFGDASEHWVVTATSGLHPDGLVFVVVESNSGRWRVRQVATPGTAVDPELGLFATPS